MDLIAGVVGSPVTVDRDLQERSYGEAEGRPHAWLCERSRPLPGVGERLHHDEGLAGAETRWQLAQRAHRSMERLLSSDAQHQIVVTHSGTVTFLIAAWIGVPLVSAGRADFPVRAGSITWLRRDPDSHTHQVCRLDDLNHLDPA